MRKRILAILVFSTLFFALVAGTASAQFVQATTQHANTVKARSAVLRGVVFTFFTDTAWLFEYGKTSALGTYTRPVAVGVAGDSFVTHLLRDIKPRTTYYYRLIAIEGGYIPTASYGAILHFTTKR